MNKTLRGIVHGKRIDLTDDPGIAEGAEVEVVVNQILKEQTWGEGLKQAAGSLSDIPDLEESMTEILDERQSSQFREISE